MNAMCHGNEMHCNAGNKDSYGPTDLAKNFAHMKTLLEVNVYSWRT